MPRIILPQIEEKEPNDTPKKFRNIDKERFYFKWDGKEYSVASDEVTTLPKYLVNYASYHLARKIVKREAIEAYVPEREDRKHIELANARIPIVDEKKEFELQKKMVIDNTDDYNKLFGVKEPEEKEEVKEIRPEEKPVGQEQFKCEVCGFVAKSRIGLVGHSRKHK